MIQYDVLSLLYIDIVYHKYTIIIDIIIITTTLA